MYAGQTGSPTFIQKLKKSTVLTSQILIEIKKLILVDKILIVNPDFKRNFQRTLSSSKFQLIIVCFLEHIYYI